MNHPEYGPKPSNDLDLAIMTFKSVRNWLSFNAILVPVIAQLKATTTSIEEATSTTQEDIQKLEQLQILLKQHQYEFSQITYALALPENSELLHFFEFDLADVLEDIKEIRSDYDNVVILNQWIDGVVNESDYVAKFKKWIQKWPYLSNAHHVRFDSLAGFNTYLKLLGITTSELTAEETQKFQDMSFLQSDKIIGAWHLHIPQNPFVLLQLESVYKARFVLYKTDMSPDETLSIKVGTQMHNLDSVITGIASDPSGYLQRYLDATHSDKPALGRTLVSTISELKQPKEIFLGIFQFSPDQKTEFANQFSNEHYRVVYISNFTAQSKYLLDKSFQSRSLTWVATANNIPTAVDSSSGLKKDIMLAAVFKLPAKDMNTLNDSATQENDNITQAAPRAAGTLETASEITATEEATKIAEPAQVVKEEKNAEVVLTPEANLLAKKTEQEMELVKYPYIRVREIDTSLPEFALILTQGIEAAKEMIKSLKNENVKKLASDGWEEPFRKERYFEIFLITGPQNLLSVAIRPSEFVRTEPVDLYIYEGMTPSKAEQIVSDHYAQLDQNFRSLFPDSN